ncbi:SAM-dependent chlorinase/fluorinase [Candidatus Synechococcus calcipolaris G9]|uniref:SAM-dependent chlorinase/fluorinase n=1 Tax=Candidatus Synechococcus calcipolaris G9 TaxID=1497997 RepID=A0ABT6F3B2_9SYNE|nr:SAM-dependent chlorinase/fluorinase [Candidatus Synechococcus calcipolaris]MDG2992309.1 SAM-dependent chlorinase/fluorinase [Candidatus Synechococcus calcipolaris G9]
MITLLTDFGLTDVYVGVMKGVIAQIAPQEQIIDLSHGIPPQDCRQASFQLLQALPHFPAGTIHVVVVDPGVGGDRRAIALEYQRVKPQKNPAPTQLGQPSSYLVGPDNGVFTSVLSIIDPVSAVELTCRDYWYGDTISGTFHGRDIFAPMAAHLARECALHRLGPAIAPSSLIQLPYLDYESLPRGWRGWLQGVDHFGNLITTIPGDCVENVRQWQIQITDQSNGQSNKPTIPGGHRSYSTVPVGELLSLVGSHGFIEIAVNGGHAQGVLGLSLEPPQEVLLLL